MKKAVAQIISTGGIYGAERILLELASYLKERGWLSHVIALSSPGAQKLIQYAEKLELKSVEIPVTNQHFFSGFRRIAHYLYENKIDLIQSHGYRANTFLSLMRLKGIRKVATVHNAICGDFKERLYEHIERRLLRRHDAVVAVSQPIRKQLLHFGVKPARCHVIMNGITPIRADVSETTAIRQKLRIPDGCMMILMLSRLAKEKRIDRVIEALSLLKAESYFHLVVAGEGPLLSELESLTRIHGLSEKVSFIGYQSDISTLIAAADLYVISSDTEGLPVSLLESMAAGLPIITTDVGEIPSVIRHQQNGWVIKPDVHALSEVITYAYENPIIAREYARQAALDFEAHYSCQAMGICYETLYHEILS